MTPREKKIVHITRRLAMEEAIQAVLSLKGPEAMVPVNYIVRVLEIRKQL